MLRWLHSLLPHLPHYGYFFGKKWKLLEAWLGPTALYVILVGVALAVLGVIFRQAIAGFWTRFPQKKLQRK